MLCKTWMMVRLGQATSPFDNDVSSTRSPYNCCLTGVLRGSVLWPEKLSVCEIGMLYWKEWRKSLHKRQTLCDNPCKKGKHCKVSDHESWSTHHLAVYIFLKLEKFGFCFFFGWRHNGVRFTHFCPTLSGLWRETNEQILTQVCVGN